MCFEVVEIGAYATTVRRRIIDMAAKIVRHGGQVILKVTAAVWNGLRFAELWQRSGAPPQFAWIFSPGEGVDLAGEGRGSSPNSPLRQCRHGPPIGHPESISEALWVPYRPGKCVWNRASTPWET